MFCIREWPFGGRRTRFRRRCRSSHVISFILIFLIALSGCASAPSSGTSDRLITAPLSTSWTTSTGTWAIVPMGHLKDPLNTFWQLLFHPAGGPSWVLATPRGVADNGGLVMTPAVDPTVTLGFLPSQNLRFSPLAQTSDRGTTWTPGVIPDALLSAPDALAASDHGDVYALVRSDGGRVLASASSHSSSWHTVLSRRTLADTTRGQSCGIGQLTALAVTESRFLLVGATCTKGVRVGVFAEHQNRWVIVGPHLSVRRGSMTSSVLRIVTAGSKVSLLLGLDSGGRESIEAAWSDSGTGPWTVSAPLATGTSERLASAGISPDGGFLVQTRTSSGLTRLAAIVGQGHNWQQLTSPPPGTEGVAIGPDGAVDALSVANSTLTDWVLGTPIGRWTRTQTINVPIDYGTSD